MPNDVETCASRGRLLPVIPASPFTDVWFWSEESPSTENPAGSPSAPATGVTPGRDAAIAARSPIWSGLTTFGSTRFSVPLMSCCAAGSLRFTRPRSAVTRTASSCAADGESVASASRKSSSATRFTSKRRGAKPIALKFTK